MLFPLSRSCFVRGNPAFLVIINTPCGENILSTAARNIVETYVCSMKLHNRRAIDLKYRRQGAHRCAAGKKEEQTRELSDYFAATRRLGNINLSVKLKAVLYRWPLFATHNPTGKTSRVTFQRDSSSRSRCIERFSV